MLAVLFNSKKFRSSNDISFSYRYSREYEVGFKQRVSVALPLYPLNFPGLLDGSFQISFIPFLGQRIIMKMIRFLTYCPLLVFEVFVLYRLFKRVNPDILHINNGGYPGALSARAAAIAGRIAAIPTIVMVVNNLAVGYSNFSRWPDYPVDRIAVRAVDLFITGSKAASEKLRSVLALPIEKSIYIHNGIQDRKRTETVEITRNRLGLTCVHEVIFGVVALLVPRKGHKVLLDSILKIHQQLFQCAGSFKVLIEGDGPLYEELVEFVDAHSLNKYVQFVLVENNISDFIAILDVLILPSVTAEDFPNVILEAMASGKPVIASRIAGTPEQVIDGKSGLLVTPGDADQLAIAINRLSLDLQLRLRMGQAAKHFFQKYFTADVAVNKYMQLYQ